VANWRKTSIPNVYVAHQRRCAAFADASARCSCRPSWRGRRWSPINHRSEWQKPVTKDRGEVLAWLGARDKGADRLREHASAGRTFESIGDEWIAGVVAGRIGRRKGRGKPYTATTVWDYARSYHNFPRPEFGPFAADDINEIEWQMWVDRLESGGALAVSHHHTRFGCLGDLRLGGGSPPVAGALGDDAGRHVP
jgi:hypothetical protein